MVTSAAHAAGWVECTDCETGCDEDDIRRVEVHVRGRDGLITRYRVLCWRCALAEQAQPAEVA